MEKLRDIDGVAESEREERPILIVEKYWIYPELKYRVPVLPVEELEEPERLGGMMWLASFVDSEGRVDEARHGWDRMGGANRKVWKREYTFPRVIVGNMTHGLIERFSKLTGITRPKPEPPRFYRCELSQARAMSFLLLTKSHLIKWKEEANRLIKKTENAR